MALPVAFAAGAASQFLMARRLEFSWEENALYNIASLITTFVALHWLGNIADEFYKSKIGYEPSNGNYTDAKARIDKIRDERQLREISITLLTSHVLGWIAGSLASAVGRYSPHHLGSALMINGTATGVSVLVLVAANPGCISKIS